jgi:hypothetical protein
MSETKIKCPACWKKFNIKDTKKITCPYCKTSWESKPPLPEKKTYLFVEGSHNNKKLWKKNIAIAIIGIIIIVILLEYPFITALSNETQTSFITETQISVTRTIIISTNTPNYSIHIPAPPTIAGEQVSFALSPNVPFIVEKKYGTNWFIFNSNITPVSGNISITYKLKSIAQSWNMEPSSYGLISQEPQNLVSQYPSNTDEWVIMPTAPSIKSLAQSLEANSTNVYSTLDNIFIWEITHVQYKIDVNETSPANSTTVLERHWGRADELAFLYASIARAVGIPTWVVFGPLYDTSTLTWSDHAWDMACLPLVNGGYVIGQIDPSTHEFLLKDPYRFIEYIDNGNPTALKYYYNFSNFASFSPGASISYEYYTSNYIKSIDYVVPPLSGEYFGYVPKVQILERKYAF